jgi:hypothetical protein
MLTNGASLLLLLLHHPSPLEGRTDGRKEGRKDYVKEERTM